MEATLEILKGEALRLLDNGDPWRQQCLAGYRDKACVRVRFERVSSINANVTACCFKNWARDKSSYRSTTGYIVYLGSHLIAWSSKHQNTLARSSTEAEFRVVASTTTELQWLLSLMSELRLHPIIKPIIYCDNLSVVHYSANLVFHSRMKHLALDFHFVHEKVQQGTIQVTHIKGDDQLVDGLTKPLLKDRFLFIIFQDWTSHASVHLEGTH